MKSFINFLPPWVETNIQPAFYDKESGTVLQQTARMYAKVNQLVRHFNCLSKETKETVDEYIAKFVELKDYVEDYFENLDVQEEINNKLDQMAESGQLADIISQYLNSTAIFGYDNVSDMKSAENLVAGSYAQTLGYYAKNDGGRALYRIREITNDDVVDEAFIVEMGDGSNHLVAEMIYGKTVNIRQVGAKGDDTTNDTQAIQKALNKVSDVIIPEGTFRVSKLILKNGLHLHGTNRAKSIIKSIDNNIENAILVTDTDNVTKNVCLDNFSVLGTYTDKNSRYNPTTVTDGIKLTQTSSFDANHRVSNMRIAYHSGIGINSQWQRELKISDCDVFDCARGIAFERYGNDTTTDSEINNCTIWNCNTEGIYIYGGANRFNNNKVFYCGFVSTTTPYSDKVCGWYARGRKLTFINCQAQECFGNGFEIVDGEDISMSGIFVDNNGLYKDSSWVTQPLPEGQDPIYNGVVFNHTRRSYLEVYGSNFHGAETPSKATQAYTVYCVDSTDVDRNEYIINCNLQLTGSIYTSETNSIILDNGVERSVLLPVSTLESEYKSSANFPLTIKKAGATVTISGIISMSDGTSYIPTADSKLLTLPAEYRSDKRICLNGAGKDSEWGGEYVFINAYVNPNGEIRIQNRSATSTIKYMRISGSWTI